MKVFQFFSTDVNSAFLYLFILFADLDYTSIVDYTVKAVIGGAVWFAFKIIGDHFSQQVKTFHRRKRHREAKENLLQESEEKK